MKLLGRKEPETPPALETERADKLGGKNAPTPRRTQARAERAKQVKGTPLKRGERRARSNEIYNQTRAAMKQTDVAKLPANERVPELVYARDLVDSRANLGTALIPVAAIYFIGSFVAAKSVAVTRGLLFLALFWFLAMIVDAVVMSRKLETKVQARFPGSTVRVRGYAGRRAFALKRMRRPIPRDIPPANRWRAKNT